ncbi:MAG TPA: hotdog domain-containing protein [Bryobacteraceae bacterium]
MHIPVGATREESLLVTGEVAIHFLGIDEGRVLSTPQLIGHLEMTCRNLIKEHVAAGQDSVGTLVDVRHLAATPIGMHVRLRAEVVSVDDRSVNCRVEAWDECEKVGEGRHVRFVIDVARFVARVQAKAVRKGEYWEEKTPVVSD